MTQQISGRPSRLVGNQEVGPAVPPPRRRWLGGGGRDCQRLRPPGTAGQVTPPGDRATFLLGPGTPALDGHDDHRQHPLDDPEASEDAQSTAPVLAAAAEPQEPGLGDHQNTEPTPVPSGTAWLRARCS